jgi:metallo-beta-lactamase class B
MLRYLASLFCGVLLVAGWTATDANSQADRAQAHVAAARAAAYEPGQDFTAIFGLCAEPNLNAPPPAPPDESVPPPTIPPRSQWYREPQKVFDNVYHVGGSNNEAIWAVTTSEGIIVINSGYEYSAEELIINGLRKMGLDPAETRYVIIASADTDEYGGAKYLQDHYNTRVVMSEAEWDALAASRAPAASKPRRDMIVTDGQELKLGDVTVRFYVTPGHSPGTVSALISPVKDGSQWHVASVFGGRAAGGYEYFGSAVESMRVWSASVKRYKVIAENAGADVFLSPHNSWDRLHDKLDALKFRQPGEPHLFVSRSAVSRYQTMLSECMDAQLAWRKGE